MPLIHSALEATFKSIPSSARVPAKYVVVPNDSLGPGSNDVHAQVANLYHLLHSNGRFYKVLHIDVIVQEHLLNFAFWLIASSAQGWPRGFWAAGHYSASVSSRINFKSRSRNSKTLVYHLLDSLQSSKSQ